MSEFFEYKFFNEKNHFDKCLGNRSLYEYNENDAKDRARAVNEIKRLIGESIDFAMKDKSCADDDEFLLRFLFARKFKIDEAFKLLLNYHDFKRRNAPILSKISALDENIQRALRDGFPTVIPQRDRKGRKILMMFAATWNPSEYSLITIFRALLLSIEKLLEDIQNQANGFVIIVDWTNFTYKQTSNLQLKVLKLMIEGLQDCFPATFKEIHFVGQPWYVEATLACIRPFLAEETRDGLVLHGANLSTLHDFIAKDVLPTELGGETKSINPLDWFHTLLESSQIQKNNHSYRFAQPTTYSQSPPIEKLTPVSQPLSTAQAFN